MRPRKEIPSRSAIVPAALRHAAARGLDVDALRLRFALPDGAELREELPAARDVADDLLGAIAQVAGDDDVALQVAQAIDTHALRLAELAARSSATVGDALRCLGRAVPLLQEGLEASLDAGRWVLHTPRRPRGLGGHVHELVLGWALDRTRHAAGAVHVDRVWMANPRPSRTAHLAAFFGTGDVVFGAEDTGFAVRAASLEQPMRLADARGLETIAPLLDAELAARPLAASFADRVAAHVAASLPGGTDAGDVARALHMSARTLHRRLEQEDARFGEVLDRARLDVARRLLADASVTLVDVAARVGFSDLATFSRAFKRWTGMPPGQWRRS
jgi:AraC-like DNA-binding protein